MPLTSSCLDELVVDLSPLKSRHRDVERISTSLARIRCVSGLDIIDGLLADIVLIKTYIILWTCKTIIIIQRLKMYLNRLKLCQEGPRHLKST